MDAALIRDHLLAPLAEVYPAPRSADGIAARLAGYAPPHATAEALEGLARRIIENRRGRSFPAVAELIDALRNLPQVGALPAPVKRDRTTERIDAEREAARLLRGTAIAAQAVQEGWGPALLDFAADHRRPPFGAEVAGCRAKSRENDRLAAEFEGGLRNHIVALRQAMHGHAERVLTSKQEDAA